MSALALTADGVAHAATRIATTAAENESRGVDLVLSFVLRGAAMRGFKQSDAVADVGAAEHGLGSRELRASGHAPTRLSPAAALRAFHRTLREYRVRPETPADTLLECRITRRFRGRLTTSNAGAAVRVADEGMGIPPADLPRSEGELLVSRGYHALQVGNLLAEGLHKFCLVSRLVLTLHCRVNVRSRLVSLE